MRIGFDGKRAVQNFTGLGNYSRYVADILCHFYPENDYVLYAPKKRENKRMNLLTGQYRQLTLAYQREHDAMQWNSGTLDCE